MVGVTSKVIFMTMMASDGFQLFDSTSPHTLLRQYKSTQLFNRVWKIYSCCFHSTFHGWVSSKVFLVPNLCAHEELGEHASETTVHRDICRVRERSGFFGGGGIRFFWRRRVATARWWCSSSLAAPLTLYVFFPECCCWSSSWSTFEGMHCEHRPASRLDRRHRTTYYICWPVRMERPVPLAWVSPMGTPLNLTWWAYSLVL